MNWAAWAAAELGFSQNVCIEAGVSSGIKNCCLNLQGVGWLVSLCPAKTAAYDSYPEMGHGMSHACYYLAHVTFDLT